MKFVKFTVVALFAALLSAGCAGEKIDFGGEGNNTISNKGYLSISELVIDCRIDESEPDAGVNPAVRSTRNAVDVNNFDCVIINEENEVVKSFKYGERPTEAVELETGGYIFKIQSGEVPGAAWDSPIYGTSKAFKIVRNQTTNISEIVCSLMQIKVTITYSADLLERLGAKTITTAKVGNNSLEFSLSESRAGYFLAPQLSNNTIELCISGTYAADKVNFKEIEMNKEVHNVKMGQHSKIHFYVEHAAEGNIKVGVTIRDWVVDETVPCNVADAVVEQEWREPSSGNEGGEAEEEKDLSLAWIGYDLSKSYNITSDMTLNIELQAKHGIKSFIVQIKSETMTATELANAGLCDVLNFTYPHLSYDSSNPETYIDVTEPMISLGFDVGDAIIGKTSTTFTIAPMFVNILSSQPGKHNFELLLIDNMDNVVKATIKLVGGK